MEKQNLAHEKAYGDLLKKQKDQRGPLPQKDVDKVIALFEGHIEGNPDDVGAKLNLARLCLYKGMVWCKGGKLGNTFDGGHPGKAEAVLDGVLSEDPRNQTALDIYKRYAKRNWASQDRLKAKINTFEAAGRSQTAAHARSLEGGETPVVPAALGLAAEIKRVRVI